MPEITFAHQNIRGAGEVIVSLITSLFRVVQHFITIISGAETDSREIAEFEKAVRTIQLAAEPGENYAAVAAKIQREAEIYKLFLQYQQPIGRISLYVRELDPNEPEFGKPRTQWLVDDPSEGGRDPIEGRASVTYRLSRSATRVLEFVVHDHNDVPLFAIARVYSNWLGRKKFPLGPNRVFYLEMDESLPGYVDVKVGFKPATAFEDDAEDENIREFPRALAVPPYTQARPDSQVPAYQRRLHRSRWVYAAECAVISIIASSLVCVAAAASFTGAVAQGKSEAMAATAGAESTSRNFMTFAGSDTSSAYTKDTRIGEMVVFDPDVRTIKVRSVQKSKRLAEVNSFSISVDNNSCKQMESQCRKLLSTVQQEVKSNLNRLNVPVLTLDQTGAGREPAKLVVSYNPINLLHGQIHLTLYDHEGDLWNGNGNLSYAELTKPEVIKTYCEAASSEIVWEIIMAKAHVSSGHDITPTESANSD
ncbi:MAG TPA: hypothetical protein VGN10_08360 [Pyrinomonadaceae bacterium]|jgi:hypothetical protein